jgi:hypothetical protein
MNRTPIRSHSKLLFSSKIRVSTGALGGNGATGAIYGELTMHSMQKITNYMVENCELTSKSRSVYFEYYFAILTVRRSTTNETYNQPHSILQDHSWSPISELTTITLQVHRHRCRTRETEFACGPGSMLQTLSRHRVRNNTLAGTFSHVYLDL